MKAWWLPWTFPVVLLVTVASFGALGDVAVLVLVPLVLVALPLVWRAANPTVDPDADVNYWRFKAPWRP